MEIERQLELPATPAVVFPLIDDLAVYPSWMALTHAVTPIDDQGPPAWDVELRARVGPLARSKRLRMVRTRHEPDRVAVFERREHDGRQHAPWVLTAQVRPVGAASSELRMHLFYGGSLWTGAVLQRVLDEEVRRGSEALLASLSSASQEPPGSCR
jgi:hypothetical protein